MPVTAAQKTAINEVIGALTGATSRRAKRRLADMFLVLVDRASWPEYYEVIPQPRCINGVKANLSQNKYKHALDAFQDLNLVFLNALYYNEEGSQIAKDASILKGILGNEWRARSILPAPPTSPPTSSAQKTQPKKEPKERAATIPAPAKSQPSSKPTTTVHPPVHATVPQASSSQTKEVTKAKSPERTATPDMDVDIGGTPEPELTGHDAARDGESEEIVRQLEKGLPRWEGFSDVGWAQGITSDRMVEIVVTLSKYRDEHGNKLAVSLEAVPEETNIPDLSFSSPLSLQLIQSRARMNYYESSQAFDKEMAQLFLKARRWYEIGTEPYGNVVVLQRFYHALTSPNPPVSPYTSSTKFAALPAGPGRATSLSAPPPEGVTGPALTTMRISLRDKKLLDEVQYKGWTIRIADWLHLSNPDDSSRPIIGHVFKCFVSEEAQRKGQVGVSVCWYFRPEQTFHPADRQFFEKEVFKSSHFADHPLEDILEKVACQFTVRHARGRPRPPFWYPGWPLYMCDARYNDRERAFVKIKNWNACIPEEVRKKEEFMPIYPFERAVLPRRVPSPFLMNPRLKGPGGLIDAVPGDKEKAESEKPDSATGRSKRPKRAAVTKAEAERAAAKAGIPYVHPTSQPSTSMQQQAPASYIPVAPPREDRSIIAAAGGLAALGSSAAMEELPAETARHFDRDPETNEVLWFAAPPVDIVHTPAPQHSLKYLAHLARKRKTAQQGDRDHSMDVDGEPPAPKRRKMPPTATETLEALLKEHGLWT
ncbi:hypothetical protein L227DRAFT_594371 [Lentinus tigrinus ALCF2SS1-6]|uniref:BAH-domain-containing protein n=1 Tax=Lentinus tigrinus ALCF2SS1-6 TaxID=1328759 RepID=A0A5C2SAX8_9APHY|nr:hypothetical protein L227DRAFT_594371 [Lentinus tigrinus ALCF2SS1-6]